MENRLTLDHTTFYGGNLLLFVSRSGVNVIHCIPLNKECFTYFYIW